MAESKVWLITGCSTGLGRKLVEEVVRRGDKAVATARNKSTIEDLKGDSAAVLQLDITASQDELNAKAAEAIKAFGQVDVVVHNAGSFQMGAWEDLTPELLQSQFATNFFGPVNFTRSILPHLRERGQGTIVFTNSSSSFQAFPGVSAYGASKAALDRMIDGLTAEVGPAGIKTLSLDVGSFESDLTATHKAPTMAPPTTHHVQLTEAIKQVFPMLAANPVIDINKLATLVFDVVRGEGVVKGKEIPLRFPGGFDELWQRLNGEGSSEVPQQLPIGADTFGLVKAKCEYYLKMLQDWEGVIKSADIEGNDGGAVSKVTLNSA